MRLLSTFAAALILAARVAHADIYTVSFSGAGINEGPDPTPYSDTFSFDSSIHLSHPGDNQFIAPCDAPDCFSTPELPNDGVLTRDFVRNEGIINYYGDLFGTEEILYFSSNSDFTGPALSPFTGSIDNPTILTGTFYAGVTFPYESYQARGTATIVDDTLSASAVPEPSTFALLGTGAFGLLGTLRRRLFA